MVLQHVSNAESVCPKCNTTNTMRTYGNAFKELSFQTETAFEQRIRTMLYILQLKCMLRILMKQNAPINFDKSTPTSLEIFDISCANPQRIAYLFYMHCINTHSIYLCAVIFWIKQHKCLYSDQINTNILIWLVQTVSFYTQSPRIDMRIYTAQHSTTQRTSLPLSLIQWTCA